MKFSRFLQDYAVRLSKSKRSSKMNSPLIRSTDSVFTSSPVSIPEPAIAKSGPGGRISLLKKQLDEQRYKISLKFTVENFVKTIYSMTHNE